MTQPITRREVCEMLRAVLEAMRPTPHDTSAHGLGVYVVTEGCLHRAKLEIDRLASESSEPEPQEKGGVCPERRDGDPPGCYCDGPGCQGDPTTAGTTGAPQEKGTTTPAPSAGEGNPASAVEAALAAWDAANPRDCDDIRCGNLAAACRAERGRLAEAERLLQRALRVPGEDFDVEWFGEIRAFLAGTTPPPPAPDNDSPARSYTVWAKCRGCGQIEPNCVCSVSANVPPPRFLTKEEMATMPCPFPPEPDLNPPAPDEGELREAVERLREVRSPDFFRPSRDAAIDAVLAAYDRAHPAKGGE